MASQVLGATSNQPSAGQPVTERPARYLSGWRMLVLCIVLLAAGVALAVQASHDHGGTAKAVVSLCVLVFIAGAVMLGGLTPVVPGRARVVQQFGKYRGTIRESGLQWVNPFTDRIKVSPRIRNQESAQAKVNDADGRRRHHRVAAHPAVLRPRDRPGHAPPAAGQRGRRRAPAHSRGCRRHGAAGPAAAGGRRRRRAVRGAQGHESPTCSSFCAASRRPSRSSTPARCTSDGAGKAVRRGLRPPRPRQRPALPRVEELRHDHPAPRYEHHRLLQLPGPRRHRVLPVLGRDPPVEREPQAPSAPHPDPAVAQALRPGCEHVPAWPLAARREHPHRRRAHPRPLPTTHQGKTASLSIIHE